MNLYPQDVGSSHILPIINSSNSYNENPNSTMQYYSNSNSALLPYFFQDNQNANSIFSSGNSNLPETRLRSLSEKWDLGSDHSKNVANIDYQNSENTHGLHYDNYNHSQENIAKMPINAHVMSHNMNNEDELASCGNALYKSASPLYGVSSNNILPNEWNSTLDTSSSTQNTFNNNELLTNDQVTSQNYNNNINNHNPNHNHNNNNNTNSNNNNDNNNNNVNNNSNNNINNNSNSNNINNNHKVSSNNNNVSNSDSNSYSSGHNRLFQRQNQEVDQYVLQTPPIPIQDLQQLPQLYPRKIILQQQPQQQQQPQPQPQPQQQQKRQPQQHFQQQQQLQLQRQQQQLLLQQLPQQHQQQQLQVQQQPKQQNVQYLPQIKQSNAPSSPSHLPISNLGNSYDALDNFKRAPIPQPSASKPKVEVPKGVGCIEFEYSVLSKATNSFNREKVSAGGSLLGEGGFGPVFKGIICHTYVAIKVLLNAEGERKVFKGFEQFLTEIITLSKYRHPNLLTMMGFSSNGPTVCIVYEFMSNGTLEDWLENRFNKPFLWNVRQEILKGTARGLHYLHKADSKHPLIHRDVKSANVLLDTKMQAKVGDFGLARELDSNTPKNTSIVLGTSGYIPPEYFRGEISEKMDIYAFGVVILEVLTGLSSFDGEREPKELVSYLRPHIWNTNVGEMYRFVDRAAGAWPNSGHHKLCHLAWLCLMRCKDDRPEMDKVLEKLEEATKESENEYSKYSNTSNINKMYNYNIM